MIKMKRIFLLCFILLLSSSVFSQDAWTQKFDLLLSKYVQTNKKLKGIQANLIDYKGIRSEAKSTVENLRRTMAQPGFLSRAKTNNDKLALWINIYNFATIDLIIKTSGNLKQFNDLKKGDKSIWKQPLVVVAGKRYTLDHIENGIIRVDFKEPRIHFVLVCAALSCPNLHNRAYIGSKLEQQLKQQTKKFFQDSTKGVKLKSGGWFGDDEITISKIFEWYKVDFDNAPRKWLHKHGYITKKQSKYKLKYFNYDWALNAPKGRH